MARSRRLSTLGLFLLLALALGAGPMTHGHAPASGDTAHAADTAPHSHDHDGAADPEERSNGKVAGHFHLPPTLDHVHDTWLYAAGLRIPIAKSSAFRPHGDTSRPRQRALARLEKPPKPSLNG